MLLGVLPDLKVYMNASASETNPNIQEIHMPMNTSCNMILPHSMDFVC